MPIIEWNSSFLLGIQEIDQHHQHLVSLLNRAYDGFTADAPAENVAAVLCELLDYTAYHFGAEEQLMKEQSFPGMAAHCEEHIQFSNKIEGMIKDYNSGKRLQSLELLIYLKNWLLNHILQIDFCLANYLTAKGTS
ncbi:bacteriohemerythrin [Pelotalea chapellei]|uniref:Hemerythrin family protein n=1 Tax=Pelotalea chapellei TaxID=44671 RepID=A0ABS5UCH1_9BACT|nr:bacteriohemerythrin [Pelotalea chapellei]MBT1073395.1 hemerythrin family protein [Pelotalea chapellei]